METQFDDVGLRIIGPLAIRSPNTRRMRKGEIIIGHKHDHDHVTMVFVEPIKFDTLAVTKVDASGYPLEATVIASVILDPAELGFVAWLVPKGVYHTMTALEDGASYVCINPHRHEHPITIDNKGERIDPPHSRRDEMGKLWVYVDERIAEVSTGWPREHQ